MKTFFLSAFLLISACIPQNLFIPPNPYDEDARILKSTGTISFELINESSAIEKSASDPEIFWTLNDSGDEARIFAITRGGEVIKPEWADDYQGLYIGGAVNIDWEDMAIDKDGMLYIAAFGNNNNLRKDLAVYILPEPDPRSTNITRVLKTVYFRYPDQTHFPPKKKNFDAEALFHADGQLFLLTKHRSDTQTKLYRFDNTEADVVNDLTYISSREVGDMVTAADASDDGKLLAVLTYTSVWIFERENKKASWLEGKAYQYPIMAKQCEGICFDKNNLLVTNEQRDIFTIPVSKVQKFPVK